MTKVIVHTDDLPEWAVKKWPYAHSYLDHLSEPVHPAPNGKGFISDEEIMLRQHVDAALKGKRGPMIWLLKRIAKDNETNVAAVDLAPQISIQGVPRIQPLAPVMAALGCIAVIEPEGEANEPTRVCWAPWFERALEMHCPPAKVELVRMWMECGGRQDPRRREEDSWT